MRRCRLKKIAFGNNVKFCVRGSHGGPQGPTGGYLPVETPGSSMNSRAHAPVLPVSTLTRAIFRITLFGALALSAVAGARLHAQSASTLFRSGQAAEARQEYDAAFDYYQKAAEKNPTDITYRAALYRVRTTAAGMHVTNGRKLLQAGNDAAALAEFLHASVLDPSNEAAQQEIRKLQARTNPTAPQPEAAIPLAEGEQQEIEGMGAPIALKPVSNEPLTLRMTEDSKVVYEAVGKAAGINVLFDPDYNSKRIQVDLNNVSLMDALRIVGTMSGTFWRPITSNTIFVAQNTRIKRTELDSQAVQTFYLSNAWQQNDLNDVQTALRNVITNAKVFGVAGQNAIVVRATPDELLLAQKIINDLDKARAEVVVDIAVMEVNKNWERNLGIAWPGSISVAIQPTCVSTGSTSCTTTSTTGTATSTVPTLYDFAHLHGSNFAVTMGAATLNLLLTNSDTKVLQSPRIRATDDQKATMKIGSRIPIATGSYQTGASTAVVSSLVNTQFQYQDVGVQIEMTPTVHFDHEVTLKIKIEVTAQSGSVTISGVTEPIISQRVVDQVIRLKEGEASLLGGIQSNQEMLATTAIPGLGSIPILKYVFGSRDHTVADDDIVFAIVPHVVRSQELNEANLRPVDTGAGQSIDLRLPPGVTASSLSNAPPAVRPAVLQGLGATVPGASATEAAPVLMSQMNAAAQNASTPPPVANPTVTPLAAPAPPVVAPQVAAPPPTASPQTPGTNAQAAAAQAAPAGTSFVFNAPPGPVTNGSTFQVPVVINSATDIASVPIQIRYDPAKLSLTNVSAGNLLNRDGQAVALIHRDDGPGNLTVVASRPPGTPGVSGSGSICVLTFQAKAAGTTALTMTRAGAVDSKQQPVSAAPAQTNIVIH
jgi:general secretion pathway protein D